MERFEERFDGLDPQRWVAAYLPAWSSREDARATWEVGDDGLRLSLPPEHPRWCPDLHEPPLRVSAVQSGSWSGPVGSTRGQQPFRPGLTVREEQPRVAGFVPLHGRIEVECRATVGAGSMFSAWTIGMEDEPRRCGEICLVEVFGDTRATTPDGTVTLEVGRGVHPFRDPDLVEEFAAPRRSLDVSAWHTYAVDWTEHGITWFLDGEQVAASDQSPSYPMLLVLAVFDFPDRTTGDHVPLLEVRRVTGR
ncbi:hypothetical protein GCM10008944_12460 [Cytobacillus oceanisediminis]